jgi:hypothetical protein
VDAGGYVWALHHCDRYDDAVCVATAALERQPNSVTLRAARSCALMAVGRFTESLADLHRVIELEPCSAAYANPGNTLRRMGR